MLNGVIKHAREDVGKVSEPKAEVLFAITAEMLQGLVTAYDH
ncbi:MAG TPA: hypothetical protein VKB53_05210 [Gammaproteobacteria bacterium]|jgi:hypothetical protein|nr:hypothetical protein [Gammaproteobacteria bacterium]